MPTQISGSTGVNKIQDGVVTQADLASDVQQVGVGQTWQNMTGSRAYSTTYTNTTGKPISVNVGVAATSGSTYATVTVTISGVAWPTRRMYVAGINNFSCPVTFIVPAGQTYSIAAVPDAATILLNDWMELR